MAKKKIKKKAAKPARKATKKAIKKAVKKAAKKKAVKKLSPKKAAKKATPKPASRPKTNVISPYLTFNGNCEEAFNYYKSVFGGQFGYVGRFKDMPPGEDGKQVSPEAGNLIMHVSLPISAETTLMGSDSSPEFGQATNIGNNMSISVTTYSPAEADRLYKGLSHGGHAVMPMSKTFWGSYFGMCTDKFGIQWMVSFDENPAGKM